MTQALSPTVLPLRGFDGLKDLSYTGSIRRA
jgi:hypothetical protein